MEEVDADGHQNAGEEEDRSPLEDEEQHICKGDLPNAVWKVELRSNEVAKALGGYASSGDRTSDEGADQEEQKQCPKYATPVLGPGEIGAVASASHAGDSTDAMVGVREEAK